jgi:hypothetical protein
MHNTGEDFLRTISAFYVYDVYFLDEDNYLDYDLEKEGIIGAKLNQGIDYWRNN